MSFISDVHISLIPVSNDAVLKEKIFSNHLYIKMKTFCFLGCPNNESIFLI